MKKSQLQKNVKEFLCFQKLQAHAEHIVTMSHRHERAQLKLNEKAGPYLQGNY